MACCRSNVYFIVHFNECVLTEGFLAAGVCVCVRVYVCVCVYMCVCTCVCVRVCVNKARGVNRCLDCSGERSWSTEGSDAKVVAVAHLLLCPP